MIPQHGKDTTYTNWKCRCVECKNAHALVYQQRKEEMQAQEIPELAHGTVQGYTKYFCRCVRCKKAWAQRAYDKRNERAQILNPVDLTDKWGTDEMWNQL